MLNLTELGKQILLKLINKSWNQGLVIDKWKIALIIMIEKKEGDSQNPLNYRPISLTNAIIKLIEKMMLIRLMLYLENKNLITIYQSGFRAKRSTIDNLFFLTQKFYEAFDGDKKAIGVVFDIMKAFDKVWHNGLIYKLSKLEIPKKIDNWIISFLKDRKFCVRINNNISGTYNITTGVPQGSILSPILFSIFINDVLELNSLNNQKINSLLFADDLFSFNIDKNLNRLKIQM